MPGAAVDIGFGTTITFATSGFTANIVGPIQWSGIARTPHETSHMASALPGANQFGGRTFMPGDLVDPGTLTIPIHFNPNTNIPIAGAVETITIAYPLVAGDATRASWAVSGFVTDVGTISIPLDGVMETTITVKMTGLATMTDAT